MVLCHFDLALPHGRAWDGQNSPMSSNLIVGANRKGTKDIAGKKRDMVPEREKLSEPLHFALITLLGHGRCPPKFLLKLSINPA